MKNDSDASLSSVLHVTENISPNELAQTISRNLQLSEFSLAEKLKVISNCFEVLGNIRIVEKTAIVRAALEEISFAIFSEMCSSSDDAVDDSNTNNAQGSQLQQNKNNVTVGTCIMCQGIDLEIRKPKKRLRRMLENSKYKDYARMKLCVGCKEKLREIVMHVQDVIQEPVVRTEIQTNSFSIEQAEGLFGAFGYRVGNSGLDDVAQRDDILQQMLHDTRSSVNGIVLKGAANTSHRFKQIVRALDFQIATKEYRTDADYELAVSHWQRDRSAFIESYISFHVPRPTPVRGFRWPLT